MTHPSGAPIIDEWPEDIDFNDHNNNREIEQGENVGLPREIIFKRIKRMKIGKSSKDCTICFNHYNRGFYIKKCGFFKFYEGELIRRLPCKHIFHEGCVIPWLAKNNRCPNCRFDLKEYYSDITGRE